MHRLWACVLIVIFFGLEVSAQINYGGYGQNPYRPMWPLPGPPQVEKWPAVQTRSLSGTIASDGFNATNEMALMLIKVGLLGGYAIRKVKMFNDRIYLSRYRRSYWLGDRYYAIDNFYYLESRDTCAYRMNETERQGLEYEDGVPIYEVIYQCQRFAEYCCGLDCCQNKGRFWKDPALDYVPNFGIKSIGAMRLWGIFAILFSLAIE